MTKTKLTMVLALILLGAAGLFMFKGNRTVAAQSGSNLTPGMLFGPLYVGDGQHAEVCFSFLSEGSIKATVHFRNFTTGEVTKGQDVSISSGGGGCVRYDGKGQIVGMARGDGAASDWVSPSNALISTMSVFDDNANTGPGIYRNYATISVIGVPKIWVRGL
jgi:hypothetical protein